MLDPSYVNISTRFRTMATELIVLFLGSKVTRIQVLAHWIRLQCRFLIARVAFVQIGFRG